VLRFFAYSFVFSLYPGVCPPHSSMLWLLSGKTPGGRKPGYQTPAGCYCKALIKEIPGFEI